METTTTTATSSSPSPSSSPDVSPIVDAFLASPYDAAVLRRLGDAVCAPHLDEPASVLPSRAASVPIVAARALTRFAVLEADVLPVLRRVLCRAMCVEGVPLNAASFNAVDEGVDEGRVDEGVDGGRVDAGTDAVEDQHERVEPHLPDGDFEAHTVLLLVLRVIVHLMWVCPERPVHVLHVKLLVPPCVSCLTCPCIRVRAWATRAVTMLAWQVPNRKPVHDHGGVERLLSMMTGDDGDVRTDHRLRALAVRALVNLSMDRRVAVALSREVDTLLRCAGQLTLSQAGGGDGESQQREVESDATAAEPWSACCAKGTAADESSPVPLSSLSEREAVVSVARGCLWVLANVACEDAGRAALHAANVLPRLLALLHHRTTSAIMTEDCARALSNLHVSDTIAVASVAMGSFPILVQRLRHKSPGVRRFVGRALAAAMQSLGPAKEALETGALEALVVFVRQRLMHLGVREVYKPKRVMEAGDEDADDDCGVDVEILGEDRNVHAVGGGVECASSSLCCSSSVESDDDDAAAPGNEGEDDTHPKLAPLVMLGSASDEDVQYEIEEGMRAIANASKAKALASAIATQLDGVWLAVSCLQAPMNQYVLHQALRALWYFAMVPELRSSLLRQECMCALAWCLSPQWNRLHPAALGCVLILCQTRADEVKPASQLVRRLIALASERNYTARTCLTSMSITNVNEPSWR